MKKGLLLLLALFTIGGMCKAQGLTSRHILLNDSSQKTVRVNKAPRKAVPNESGSSFWLTATSSYDEYGFFDVSGNPAYKNMSINISLDGDSVTFSNLVDLSSYSMTGQQPIKGVYNPSAKTIKINTPGYDTNRKVSDYYQLGTVSEYGVDYTVVLFAGNFGDTPDESGQYSLITTDSLVFDVNDDFTELTPRSGFGAYGFSTYSGSFLDWYKTASIVEMPNAAALKVSPDTLVFSGQSVTVGASNTKTITLSNYGLTNTSYSAKIEPDDGQLQIVDAYNRTINGGENSNIQVRLIPNKSGAYTGKITFTADNGSVATLNVKADVTDAPDFSQIVKNGDFTFSFSDTNYPFVITDTITGQPVAVAGNINVPDYSEAQLNVDFDVPEGKTGVVSWKGLSHCSYGNGATITVDGEQTFSNSYSHGFNGNFDDDISDTRVFKAGHHRIEFLNYIGSNWFVAGYQSVPFWTYVYDFDMQLANASDHSALLKNDSLNFGNHYYDKLSVRDTLTVNFVNVGSEPLKVNSIESAGVFSGVVPDSAAQYASELPVSIVYDATGAGNFAGNVVIRTNAGDFTIKCAGSNEQIPTDYSPIVTKGDFSFNTSFEHPFEFIVDSKTASSSIAYLPTDGTLNSWLEASFEVPEGQQATLSWTGVNSSDEPFNMMGVIQYNDGTKITIDGGKYKEYGGYQDNETNASSDTWDAADLIFQPGRHTIRYYYHKVYSDPKGGDLNKDRFDLSNLALETTTSSGIENISSESGKTLSRIEIYDASGARQSNYVRGLNLVRKVYTDGTVITKKVFLK